jgi:hypothetical protein
MSGGKGDFDRRIMGSLPLDEVWDVGIAGVTQEGDASVNSRRIA